MRRTGYSSCLMLASACWCGGVLAQSRPVDQSPALRATPTPASPADDVTDADVPPAQRTPKRAVPDSAPAETGHKDPSVGQEQASVTQHTMRVGDRTISYTATAGLMPIRDEQGHLQAEIFYVAYTRDGQKPADRPITFAFNGGPGAASIWLHLAALGPKRAVFAE